MSPLIGGMGGRGHGDFPTAIIEGPPGPPGVKGEAGKAGTNFKSGGRGHLLIVRFTQCLSNLTSTYSTNKAATVRAQSDCPFPPFALATMSCISG